MKTIPRKRVTRRSRQGLRFPREHGFWTMLVATQLVSLAKMDFSWIGLGVSLLVVAVAALGAGAVGRRVRRSPLLQVALAAGLGVTGLPVELALGGTLASALETALAWCVVFAASALLVRSMFVRRKVQAGMLPRYKLVTLEATALGACALSAAAFVAWGQSGHALALVLATLFLGAVGAVEPAPKHVKPVGLALAALMVVCGSVLAFGQAWGERLLVHLST